MFDRPSSPDGRRVNPREGNEMIEMTSNGRPLDEIASELAEMDDAALEAICVEAVIRLAVEKMNETETDLGLSPWAAAARVVGRCATELVCGCGWCGPTAEQVVEAVKRYTGDAGLAFRLVGLVLDAARERGEHPSWPSRSQLDAQLRRGGAS